MLEIITEYFINSTKHNIFLFHHLMIIFFVLFFATLLSPPKIHTNKIVVRGLQAILIIFGLIGLSVDRVIVEYSKTQLEDLSLDSSQNVYLNKSATHKQVGELTFTPSERANLGSINCQDESFKVCIDEIKAHKAEVISELQTQ